MEWDTTPFFTTRDKGKGTGMGLSVVHGIIDDYHGKIMVESALGMGSMFTLYLPAIDYEEIDVSVEESIVPAGREKILFVDDEELLTDLGKHMLGELGYIVEAHTDSVEALRIFEKEPHSFDLIITDMTMPNLTGEDLAKKILHIRPDLPIILCTGYSEKITEEDALELGLSHFLLKPLIKKDIAEVIRDALDHKANKTILEDGLF